MENIGTALTEEAAGKNVRSFEVKCAVDEDTVPVLFNIMESTKCLQCLVIRGRVCEDSAKLTDKLKLLEHLLSVSILHSGFFFPSFVNSNNLINIHTLAISDLNLSSEDVHLLCGVLKQLESLWKFSNNEIDDAGAVALAEALKNHTSLAELDLSSNKSITSVGMSTLAPVVRANNIQCLNVSQTMLDKSCNNLAMAVGHCGGELQSLIH